MASGCTRMMISAARSAVTARRAIVAPSVSRTFHASPAGTSNLDLDPKSHLCEGRELTLVQH